MQENLCDLRKIAGWTAEALANKLGVTKQTISNIENQKVKLSRIQYIAIRCVFECEVSLRRDNTTLRKVMGVLFGAMPSQYKKKRELVRTAMISIASIASAGISGMQLNSSAIALLAPLGIAMTNHSTYSQSEPSLQWLVEMLENSKDERENIQTEDQSDEES